MSRDLVWTLKKSPVVLKPPNSPLASRLVLEQQTMNEKLYVCRTKADHITAFVFARSEKEALRIGGGVKAEPYAYNIPYLLIRR
jgi:hypothetical protein